MMKAYDLLLTRQSNGLLTSPGPDNNELDFILNAGMRAPDHGGLVPWRFTIVSGEGLGRLSEIFVQATEDTDKHEKVRNMPFRAPLIIIVTCQYTQHDKVPNHEQLIAAGCSVHAMQMAAYTLGYGAIWRTGELAHSDVVKHELGVSSGNDIVGFLYIGTDKKVLPMKPQRSYQNYLSTL